MIEKFISALLFLACAAPLSAQSKGDPKPSEPVLKRAPSRSVWTVHFHADRDKAKAKMEKKGVVENEKDDPDRKMLPRSLEVTKDGNTYREITRWGSGQTTEKWIMDGLQLYEISDSKRLARAVLPTNLLTNSTSDYRRSDFEELEWVGLENFRGVSELGKQKVFVFQAGSSDRSLSLREQQDSIDPDGDASEQPFESAAQKGGDFTAYFDVDTQLPLYFDDGNVIRTYEFSKRRPSQLVPPPRFVAEFETWKGELRRRGPLPPP